MRNVWFVAVPVLVAALWTLLLWTPATEPGSSAAEDADTPPAERAQRAPEPPAVEPAPTPASVPAPPPDPDPPVKEPAPELPRLPPPTMQGPVSALKHHYEGESSAGSPPAQQQQLTAAVQAADADLLDNVECRRTVCRVRLAWMPKHGFSGMRMLAELRRDFDPNLAIDQSGSFGATGAQSVEVFIDLTSSRPKVP